VDRATVFLPSGGRTSGWSRHSASSNKFSAAERCSSAATLARSWQSRRSTSSQSRDWHSFQLEVHIPEDSVIPLPEPGGNPVKIGPTILAYMVNPSSGAENLKYEIKFYHRWIAQHHAIPPLPGQSEDIWTPITSGELSGGVRRGCWEAISSNLLRLDIAPFNVPGFSTAHSDGSFSQSVEFSVTSGHGSVTFSDVVLWFRR